MVEEEHADREPLDESALEGEKGLWVDPGSSALRHTLGGGGRLLGVQQPCSSRPRSRCLGHRAAALWGGEGGVGAGGHRRAATLAVVCEPGTPLDRSIYGDHTSHSGLHLPWTRRRPPSAPFYSTLSVGQKW